MILVNTLPVYRTEPARNAIHIVEWKTYKDPISNKVYQTSREYDIMLYTKNGIEKQYTNGKNTVDIMV